MTDPLTYAVLAYSGALVVTTLMLIYPVVAYARNVAYTEALVSLALAFVMITVVALSDFVFELRLLANAARFAGALFGLVGIWFFAREFVHLDDLDLEDTGGLWEDGD